MDNFEKTAYETNPVESPAAAIFAFVEAYDALQKNLAAENFFTFSDALKTAMYQPVRTNEAPISIYEIGVVYQHDKKKYGINAQKLNAALILRRNDVRELFVSCNGILPKLNEMLVEFSENNLHENIYEIATRFLNECRRLSALWE
ncbi:MAG: hypothetical protein FWD19_05030 [Defluviitaleaceae bacterium]|nr:hypothetical protein [Defluviitaleaceae bacterium]